MSALSQRTDIAEREHHVRFVPTAEVNAPLDHLVGGGEERFFAAVPCLVVSVRSAAATVSPALAAFTCPCRRRLT
jgi:hypothetical protein